MSLFDNRKVCAAVRSEEDFLAAIESKVDVIFLLRSNIISIGEHIKKAHKRGKKVLVHMDFSEGIGKDRAGLEYLKICGADGIITTKTSMVRPAKDLGLITVQRFFIVDSHSVDTAVETIMAAKPDVVEIMPGVVEKKIKEFSKRIEIPLLAGGLIEHETDVESALRAGAKAISTAKRTLWNIDFDK